MVEEIVNVCQVTMGGLVMVRFMCQLDQAAGCPDFLLNILSGCVRRVFPGGISIELAD